MEMVLDLVLSLVKSWWSFEDKIEGLKRTIERIKGRLMEAEMNRRMDDDLSEMSLHWLRSLYFDIDNLLDEYESDRLLQEANLSPKRKRNAVELLKYSPNWSLIWRLQSEIYSINQRWEEFQGDRIGPKHDVNGQSQQLIRPSEHDEALGREGEKNEIVKLLLSSLVQGDELRPTLPVVPIYGTAGIGKTTLAKMVYEDSRIDAFFDLKAWVTLTVSCDAKYALNEIYTEITGKICSGGLNLVQQNLKMYFRRHRTKFLLVIDNFCVDADEFWDILREPLLEGLEGSKVLITTRNYNTCLAVRALSQPCLTGLSDKECCQLFQSFALHQDIDDHDKSRLMLIGREIAKKCMGCPLAAKIFGSLLYKKSEEEWCDKLTQMRVLNLKKEHNGVLASLTISYHQLTYDEKRCFAYCCIFPNGYVFERDQLIRCWMAEGLINSHQNNQHQLEVDGGRYFESLVRKSFFESFHTLQKEKENLPTCQAKVKRYRMPALICELAKVVSEYELREIKYGYEVQMRETSRARYASLLHHKDLSEVQIDRIEPYSSLRTLKLCAENNDCVVPLRPIPSQFFCKFRDLRVLDLGYSDLQNLPTSVGCLIHLRYLGLSNTKIRTIPMEVCGLINLETIDLKSCPAFEQLPEGMDRLIYLRHLDLHLEWEQINDSTGVLMPQGIGKMKQLRTLSRFNVTGSADGQQCNISMLKDLNLGGDLCILNLENVPFSKPDEASNANLQEKKSIENLLLRWCDLAYSNKHQVQCSKRVTECLKPHDRLKSLWLINYPGKTFPDWMGAISYGGLHTIRISNYQNFDFLGLLGKLPHLKNLRIDNVRSNAIGQFVGFRSLEYLIFFNLPFLEKLSLETYNPKLKKFHLSDCPCLSELIIHRNLHDKLDQQNCSNLLTVTYVP